MKMTTLYDLPFSYLTTLRRHKCHMANRRYYIGKTFALITVDRGKENVPYMDRDVYDSHVKNQRNAIKLLFFFLS